VDEDNDQTHLPVLSLSFCHTKKSPVEAKTLGTREKHINHGAKLEKEDSFKGVNVQETSKETECCHAIDGE
jgi:hypothetical protein